MKHDSSRTLVSSYNLYTAPKTEGGVLQEILVVSALVMNEVTKSFEVLDWEGSFANLNTKVPSFKPLVRTPLLSIS